jgi:hypothetical protein
LSRHDAFVAAQTTTNRRYHKDLAFCRQKCAFPQNAPERDRIVRALSLTVPAATQNAYSREFEQKHAMNAKGLKVMGR